MATKTNNLTTIYKYLLTNEKVLRITDIQIVKKGNFSSEPYIQFRCVEGPAIFSIYHSSPLLSSINLKFEFAMNTRVRPQNWQGSYDDLICLAKSFICSNDQVAMVYAEKQLDTVLFNRLTYSCVEDFLGDIDKIVTHYYKMAFHLYTKINTMEVDYRNSIVDKSMLQKYSLSFRSERLFAIASEIL